MAMVLLAACKQPVADDPPPKPGMVAMSLGGEGEDLYACTDLDDPRCDERTEEERAEIDAENARHLPACVRGVEAFFAP
jgi:hypothetical protein